MPIILAQQQDDRTTDIQILLRARHLDQKLTRRFPALKIHMRFPYAFSIECIFVEYDDCKILNHRPELLTIPFPLLNRREIVEIAITTYK